jgi:membrane associated rhomboid family serine protease
MEKAVWFGGALLAFVVWLFFWRWSSRLRVDADGIRLRRAFIERFFPWESIRAVRQQGLEVEFERDRGRISLNLDLLHGRGSPLLLRRRSSPALTPLGSNFLRWIGSRVPNKEEVSIFGSRKERLISRAWTFLLVSANVWMFLESRPPSVLDGNVKGRDAEAFLARLRELGARTEVSFEEPWRFFAALFLHGNILHIGLNMLIIVSLAPWLIRIFGLWRGTLVYLGGGFLGNALAQSLHELLHPDETILSVGASTAVLAIIGALLGGIYRRPYSVPLVARARFRWAIPVVFILTVGMDSAFVITDSAAHFCGFLVGFALALIVPPRPVAVP